MSKRFFLGIFAILSIWAVARFCHHQTKGFRLSKLQNNTTCLSQPSPPLPNDLRNVLGQKFRFFGRGLQSFSFVSEDETTILKLFNNRYQRRISWLRFTPFQEKISYNQKKWKMAFTSYQIAYDHLRKETGLYYVHPAKSTDCPSAVLVDPLGIEHHIDLNKYGFALQKKATMAYPYFATCAAASDFEKAKAGFDSLFALLKGKMERGIEDRDPLIRTNFGFLGDRAVQIDIGALFYNSSLKSPEKQKEDIEKISIPLKHWLETHHPQLLPSYYDALQDL
ncbi:MAG: hypothetical protein K940chlam6_00244 [Chlamydiae bacterium]|nr:hypothetical protein [Chlamydiota bacterium]